MLTKQDIFDLVEEEDVRFIRLQFTDMLGTMRNLAITTSRLEDALDNLCMFDGSSIMGFVGVEESDLYYIPTLTHLKFSLGDRIRERSQDLYAMFISLTVHVLKVTRDIFCKRLLKKRKKWVTNLMWDLNVNSSYLIRTNAVILRQSRMTMRVILTWHRLITAKLPP